MHDIDVIVGNDILLATTDLERINSPADDSYDTCVMGDGAQVGQDLTTDTTICGIFFDITCTWLCCL